MCDGAIVREEVKLLVKKVNSYSLRGLLDSVEAGRTALIVRILRLVIATLKASIFDGQHGLSGV
jgi:hypothetical protein